MFSHRIDEDTELRLQHERHADELFGIVDLGTQLPAIDSAAFPNTPFYGAGFWDDNAGQYWSSTSRDYNDFALYGDFSFGDTHFYVQSEDRHVRCVR